MLKEIVFTFFSSTSHKDQTISWDTNGMSLNLTKTLKRLEAYTNSPSPILSVYFHLPVPKLYTEETIANKLQSVLVANLSLEQRKELQEQIAFVQGYIKEYQQKKGEETLAFFSGGTTLFEVLHLPYKIANQAVVSHSPWITPVLSGEAEYRRYLVIFLDKQGARLFTLTHGAVEQHQDIRDNGVPQNIHQDASEALYSNREDKIDRHIQDHLHRHFQRIAQKVEAFVGNTPLNGVLIAGHKQMFHEFIKTLPKKLQNRIVAQFPSELHINENDLIQKSNDIINQMHAKFNTQSPAYS